MAKHIVFQNSFLVSGIMCHKGCGATIRVSLDNTLDELKEQGFLPRDAQLVVDAEPQALGIHRLILLVESEDDKFDYIGINKKHLATRFHQDLDDFGYQVVQNDGQNDQGHSGKINWLNITVNLLALAAIITLSIVFPPSLPLTIGLTAIAFATTAFTARHYLINFFKNLRHKTIATMDTPITLGWALSLAHTLYHAIRMPMMTGFSMIFMSFAMPVTLITIVNVMDEIKRLVLSKSRTMYLQGVKSLFPQMAEKYHSYSLLYDVQVTLDGMMNREGGEEESVEAFERRVRELLDASLLETQGKNTIRKGMVLTVRRGECFPVDGIIIQGSTFVDASLLTGESNKRRQCRDAVPAGAINLGRDVTIYATADSYNSTVNKLLFRSNRAQEIAQKPKSHKTFVYLYSALIIAGIAASILIPLALGLFYPPLLLQNITGILFTVCPCTMAIAHQLPKLLSTHGRHQQGIVLRDDRLTEHFDAMHTIVFDKTGTLTTGESEVDSSEGISNALWRRIYLLEKHHGAEHPLAKAIIRHFEATGRGRSLIQDISEESFDSNNRGLSALVQGRRIHIGNAEFLQRCGVRMPSEWPLNVNRKLNQGCTPVFVAEDGVYQGVVLVRHEVRRDVMASLRRLKRQGKRLILLTGDGTLSARGFNRQNGNIFAHDDVHAEQTPENKEEFLKQLMSQEGIDPKGVWFVGDGLNDAPCARIVSDKGGISCSMTANDKSAFFTDLTLNGSLDYLFRHNSLNRFLRKDVLQNQWILAFGALAFLAFIITFSIVGVAVPPLIPMAIMSATTLFTLFNSYRVRLSVDCALDNNSSWFKRLLASDLSLGLLAGGGALLIGAVLTATVATGGLALPAIVFTAGAAAVASSVCYLAAAAMFGLFALLASAYLVHDKIIKRAVGEAVEHSSGNDVTVQPGPRVSVSEGSSGDYYSSPIFKPDSSKSQRPFDRQPETGEGMVFNG
ncbi:heavy metal translocating P-type ATPase [Legionella spiritensis]|uniref:Copper transporting P-type ATPase n=1 Tax=Legionella spiritensis TaxID=452 RepID=A0A0W0YXD8_LEGSP|nr:HAD-IC family P-type ATPase [Legionella spiritensis]KTD61543.1 copper transporting P-type ATPase [Legionella spiritensis]SNV32600.1 Putative cation-transporting P-type ATPase [Legionella spiritensis]